MNPARIDSIDRLKGLAILGVILIHSGALRGEPIMTYGFNHSVPFFVILAGLNGVFWWANRSVDGTNAALWYRNRAARILPPMWAALALWWLSFAVHKPAAWSIGVETPLLHVVGYWRGVGTGWFVTLIVQIVLVFPLLMLAFRRLGSWLWLTICLAVMLFMIDQRTQIVASVGAYNYRVMLPRMLAHVALGMALAPHFRRLGLRVGLVAAGLASLCIATPMLSARWAPYTYILMEFPGVVALLAVLQQLDRIPRVEAPWGFVTS